MPETKAANYCFGCGESNAGGMRLAFARDDERRRIHASLRISSTYQGGLGMVHGGIIALILDEAMGKVCRFRDVRAVTASLAVEFKKPVPVEEEILVEAFEESADGRNLHIIGEIRRPSGELLARGKARFVAIDPSTYRV